MVSTLLRGLQLASRAAPLSFPQQPEVGLLLPQGNNLPGEAFTALGSRLDPGGVDRAVHKVTGLGSTLDGGAG
jgi:hypothetical protein